MQLSFAGEADTGSVEPGVWGSRKYGAVRRIVAGLRDRRIPPLPNTAAVPVVREE
jgi:hypothetical protein